MTITRLIDRLELNRLDSLIEEVQSSAYAKGRAEAIAEIEARIGEAYDGFPGDWATEYERGVKNGIAICARFCRSLLLKEQEGRNG